MTQNIIKEPRRIKNSSLIIIKYRKKFQADRIIENKILIRKELMNEMIE